VYTDFFAPRIEHSPDKEYDTLVHQLPILDQFSVPPCDARIDPHLRVQESLLNHRRETQSHRPRRGASHLRAAQMCGIVREVALWVEQALCPDMSDRLVWVGNNQSICDHQAGEPGHLFLLSSCLAPRVEVVINSK
jgi:hypothetical protein